MRTPFLKRHIALRSGVFAFFPLSRTWRSLQSVACSDLLSRYGRLFWRALGTGRRRGDVYRPRGTFAGAPDPGTTGGQRTRGLCHPPHAGNGRPTTGRRRGTVFVTVKAWRVPAVAEAIRPMVRPGTCVVSLQNDAEAPKQLAAVLGAASVVDGVCGLFNFIVAPGHIRHA